jgi:tight adherence protein C
MTAFAIVMMMSSSLAGFMKFAVVGLCLAMGVMLPKVWLENRVRLRQKVILKSLPDAFDLITTCVEAGLGLEAALARVAEKVQGPFGEELTVMLQDVALGKLRRDALREVAERTGVPDLTSFINAVIQAETMGTSIAAVLRVQADQMRIRRRQRAEQEAQAAPIKMMFPLVLFIFPTMFIVILGPAAISIYETLIAKE